MSLESESHMLTTIKDRSLGVRDLIDTMGKRAETVISLIKRMEAMGLVEVTRERSRSRGRPKHVVSITVLGEDYLDTLNELKVKPLRSNRNDLIRAKKDAEYVNRLVERGRDPCQAFLELNRIVWDSRDSR